MQPASRFVWVVLVGLLVSGCSVGERVAMTPESTGYVTADDGVKLFYRKVGAGERTVVLPADLFLYPALRDIAPDRTLVFYDMRNRGRSDSVSVDQENSIEQDVTDLETLRAQLGIETMDLVGWSYLGLMAALYAIEHPERVERIVQIGAVPMRFDTSYPEGLGAGDYYASLDSAGLAEIRALRATGFHESNPQEYCEREWAVTRFSLVGNPDSVHRVPAAPCDMPNEWPVRFAAHLDRHFTSVQRLEVPLERIEAIEQPVLVIHGTLDRNAAYGAGREWALHLPGARMLTVEGAAHCPWADHPDFVLDAIRTFLGGGWPDGVEDVERLERGAIPGS